jgi:hypothetical protein
VEKIEENRGDNAASGLPTLNVLSQAAKGYSSYCEINFKKVSKSFFLSWVLRYYHNRPPNPATQVASHRLHLEHFSSA